MKIHHVSELLGSDERISNAAGSSASNSTNAMHEYCIVRMGLGEEPNEGHMRVKWKGGSTRGRMQGRRKTNRNNRKDEISLEPI